MVAFRVWIGTLAIAQAMTACGPRRDPNAPGFPVPPPPPSETETEPPAALSSRAMPAPVLGRFEQPTVAASPSRAMITEPPPAPTRPEPQVPSQPATTSDALPDEVVVRLLEGGRAAFVRCFKNAIVEDPTDVSFKVVLHVELDENGAITATRTDSDRAALDHCLVRMTALLRFPASGKPINVDVPLFYRDN